MFITLTIDTNQKKNSFINLHKSKVDAKSGWRKTIHGKKRSLWQKMQTWRKTLKPNQYKLGGQAAMF